MPRRALVPDAVSSRPARVAVAAALALGLLGGCSFGGTGRTAVSTSAAPTVAASPTPIPAATPSPTTTPKPERPAAMDTVNLDGAIATATYFMQLYPYAYNTGDATQLKELSHPECIFCKSVTDESEQLHARGEHQEGSATRVRSTRGTEVHPGYWYSVNASVEQDGWQILDAAGNVIGGEPTVMKTYAMTFAVVYQGGGWLVRGAEFTVE